MARSRKRSRSRSRGRGGCPPGQIRRKGYSYKRRGKTVRVKSTCIKDVGLPGKGPKLWTVTPGLLRQYGYDLDVSAAKRHEALRKSVRHDGYATTIRRLNAIANYVHRSQPHNYTKYRGDMKWIQEHLRGYSLSARRRKSRSKSKKRRRSR